MIKIFVSENNDRVEFESVQKGCRCDVLVEIDGNYYKPFVNTVGRLTQEANDAFSQGMPYDVEPCQILVAEANIENIIKTILYLHDGRFFDSFVPVDVSKLYRYGFQHLSDIANWVQVY